MTKVIKWWKRMTFWKKAGLLVTPFATGGEVIVLVNHSHWVWHIVVVVATAVSVYSLKFTDNNNDGIVDQLQ